MLNQDTFKIQKRKKEKTLRSTMLTLFSVATKKKRKSNTRKYFIGNKRHRSLKKQTPCKKTRGSEIPQSNINRKRGQNSPYLIIASGSQLRTEGKNGGEEGKIIQQGSKTKALLFRRKIYQRLGGDVGEMLEYQSKQRERVKRNLVCISLWCLKNFVLEL